MYDNKPDTRYFSEEKYKGFNGRKLQFAINAFWIASKYDAVILSHIHLSAVALLIKLLFPSRQIILVAHGVEVWRKLSTVQKKLLQKADKILAVSAFTRQKLVEVHGADANKITVFHNTIDPYFKYPADFNKPKYLLERYGLKPQDAVIFTLTRLAATEKNKGYDYIIKALSQLKQAFPGITYILAGKYDESEKQRLDHLVKISNATGNLVLAGFIADEEITDHYLLADAFILPSQKEGFGIVFIEAMACGLPVIAGNKDGSVDALKNGQLGVLVNPDSETEIHQALEACLTAKKASAARKELQQKVCDAFGFEAFKENLEKVLV